MEELNIVQRLIIWIPPVLFAVTFHEVAHGWTALRFGDVTAWSQGRLSLNPLSHVDPIGTVVVPALLFFLGGFIFGWAKPVPVNFNRLKHPKRDMTLVALAGPSANLAMATGWALVMVLGKSLYLAVPWLGEPLYHMGRAGILVNIIIGVLNMLPVPPLDGSRVLAGLLPDRYSEAMARLEPYGLIILVILLATGALGAILSPPVYFMLRLFFSIFGY